MTETTSPRLFFARPSEKRESCAGDFSKNIMSRLDYDRFWLVGLNFNPPPPPTDGEQQLTMVGQVKKGSVLPSVH
jgi:hypothetical protein